MRDLYSSFDPYAMPGQQHLHPSFLAMDEDRNFFGVAFESEAPLELEVQPGVNTTAISQPVIVARQVKDFIILHLNFQDCGKSWFF